MARANNINRLYRCDSAFDGKGGVRLISDNKVYSGPETVPRTWFEEHVIAKVMANVIMQGSRLLSFVL